MSAAFEKLRAIREHIAALRAVGIDDYANLSALFTPLRKLFRRRWHAASPASASISPVM
ncbi:MAG: hypothetical protein JWQ50_1819 [Caballeronia mineralivorans]|jgi:hypothetical protein|nr:hypothetical protein [Caballeronia mineralivorans]MEA3101540.1 hypothetical protein [Caballeronia mineralivorans]